jgi:hypothetical protein
MKEHTDLPEKRSLNSIAYQLVQKVLTDPKRRHFCLYRRYGTWRIVAMGSQRQRTADAANYFQGLAGIYSGRPLVKEVVEDMQYTTRILFEKRRMEV